jgi:hypothetical protein
MHAYGTRAEYELLDSTFSTNFMVTLMPNSLLWICMHMREDR